MIIKLNKLTCSNIGPQVFGNIESLLFRIFLYVEENTKKMGKFWVRCLLIEKDVFSSCHERGTKKKTLSPHEESHCRPSDSALRRSASEPQRLCGEQGTLRSLYLTRILHTVRVSNVVCVMFCKSNTKDGKF